MIYFVQDPTTHEIKIGFTDGEADHRRKQFQTGNPRELILLLTTDGDRPQETELHERFKSSRGLGEWFKPTPELLQFILKSQAEEAAAVQNIDAEADDHRRQQTAQLVAAGWPPFLTKAAFDGFSYACSLRNGAVFTFEYAEDVGPGWVRLKNVHGYVAAPVPCKDIDDTTVRPTFSRGLDVRLCEILWVTNGPFEG